MRSLMRPATPPDAGILDNHRPLIRDLSRARYHPGQPVAWRADRADGMQRVGQ